MMGRQTSSSVPRFRAFIEIGALLSLVRGWGLSSMLTSDATDWQTTTKAQGLIIY